MKKIKITHLDLDLYTSTLHNGLNIYIIPQPTIDNIYVTYTTNFGAKTLDYKYNNKIYHMSAGIAHFLEHKLFEQENGETVHEKFEKNGAYNNAFTSYTKTSYVFDGPTNFENNMEILIDYVNHPYFTDQNVDKEKGIIIQELKTTLDNPYRNGMRILLENMLVKHPMRNHILGTVESISNITKEELYDCYNAFYDPENMFITITGNVEPNNALKIIKKYFDKKTKNNHITVIKCHEPLKVKRKKEIINMNVTVPKFFMGIKIDMNSYPLSIKEWKKYMSVYLDSLLSPTSTFADELKQNQIIKDDIEYTIDNADNYMLITIVTETRKPNKLEKILKENIKTSIDETTFNRKKKCRLSAAIKQTDSIYSMNFLVADQIIKYGSFDPNYYEQIKDMNYKKFSKFIKAVDLTNTSTLIIKPIKEK